MPVVQHTAACWGSRPVAKAFGASAWEMYSRGIGWRACVDSSRTTRYMTGCSTSLTGWACIDRSASLSLFQYANAFVPTASTSATSKPVRPKNAPPTTTMTAARAPSRRPS